MNEEERIAEKYLSALSLGNPRYEPDGNIPPDFLLGSQVAIEVRRLNENFIGASHSEGLETATINLWRLMNSLTASYPKQRSEKTYWISIRYQRPLPPMRGIRRSVKRILDEFLRQPTDLPQSYEVFPELHIEIRYLGPVTGLDLQRYAMATGTDRNRGGFVIPGIIKNLEFCITEKSEKIRPYIQKYPEWWLVLIDYLTWGLPASEVAQLHEHLPDKGPWDKIVLIKPTTADVVLTF